MVMKVCIAAFLVVQLGLVSAGGVTNTNDGGSTGDDGSHIFDGTPNTAKIVGGAYCSKENETALAECTIVAFENDVNFTFEDTGDRVAYVGCELLETESLLDTNERIHANCSLERLSNNTENVTAADRTFALTVGDLDVTTDGNKTCGLLVRNGLVYASYICRLEDGFDSHFDIQIEVGFLIANIMNRTVSSGSINPELPGKIPVAAVFDVELKCYQSKDGTLPDAEKTVTGSNFVDLATQSNRLGISMYCEVCLTVPSGSLYIPANTNSPVGVFLHTCRVDYTYLTTPGVASVPQSGSVVIQPDGCSVTTGRGSLWRLSAAAQKRLVHSTGNSSNNNYYPLCQRTDLTALVVPARKIQGTVMFNLTCKVSYCTVKEANCLWNTGSSYTQPPCTPTSGRKKRSDEFDGLPEEVFESYIIDISPDPEELDVDLDIITKPEERTRTECFEKKTFFSITIALGILLLIVFAIALVLFVKLRTDPLDSGSSAEGFRNKAFN